MPKADVLCAPEQPAIHNPRKFLLANNTVQIFIFLCEGIKILSKDSGIVYAKRN